ncbi:MAG: D-2-hydroxyacid dehydrogenase [Provencibacterium sp.]|jgi:phosphoglycerate dehydrogenase-like enzyme|nr:D-2-hydroxyacid dehydrogenase [Provencibacterium sp.]
MNQEIHAVLATVRYDEPHLKRLIDAFAPAPVYHFDPQDKEGIRSVLQNVDVAVLDADLDDQILAGKNLRWIHCSHAGLTKSARPEVFRRGIILTGAAGRSAPSLAEHVFFFALSHVYDAKRLFQAQAEHNWTRFSQQFAASKGLSCKTMGVIGLGNTGSAVARRAKAFEMRVLGYDRYDKPAPENVDVYYAMDRGETIEPILRESDFVVLCCHLSDETYHMIGMDQMKKMKPTACLINLARGSLIDENALYQALRDGVIARAGCDVFEKEPLPADSPLWDLPNMMVSPHSTPRVADIYGNALDILIENIGRYRRGEPMRNRLGERDVYTK